MAEPFVWLGEQLLWILAILLFTTASYLIPIGMLWLAWAFGRKHLESMGIKEAQVKKATWWYFRILVWCYQFVFFVFPSAIFRAARTGRRRFGTWLSAASPVWHARLRRIRIV